MPLAVFPSSPASVFLCTFFPAGVAAAALEVVACITDPISPLPWPPTHIAVDAESRNACTNAEEQADEMEAEEQRNGWAVPAIEYKAPQLLPFVLLLVLLQQLQLVLLMLLLLLRSMLRVEVTADLRCRTQS